MSLIIELPSGENENQIWSLSNLIVMAEDKSDAEDIISYVMKITQNKRRDVLETIGYVSGYLSGPHRAKVEELFGSEHPYFGTVKEMGYPSTEESLECGRLNITLKKLRAQNGKKGINNNSSVSK